jgi:hypothetical protein
MVPLALTDETFLVTALVSTLLPITPVYRLQHFRRAV